MPMHDWTRLEDYAFHHFHTFWLTSICRFLNRGLLPEGYYARAEQRLPTMGPDVLALKTKPNPSAPPIAVGSPTASPMTVATAPPRVRVADYVTARPPRVRRKRLAIHHRSDDNLVAIVEIVSPGNKGAVRDFAAFRGKVVRAIEAGIHVLVIDPLPPGPRDPNGIHAAVWRRLGGKPFALPADKRLTCAAYEAGVPGETGHRCYVEPFAVGDPVPVMPLFLAPGEYVNVPLEQTYLDTWPDVLPQDRAALEAP